MKDYYDFLLYPSKKDIIKETNIKKLFGIYRLQIPNSYNLLSQKYRNDTVTDTALITWNNEIINIRLIYTTSIKYYKKYIKVKKGLKKEAYEYWCRKYLEQTLIALMSLYDKSLHIINGMYNLKVNINPSFEKCIFQKLENSEDQNIKNILPKYLKIKSDFSIYKPKRNNSVHNFSELFPAFEVRDNRWMYRQRISIEEVYKNIENLKDILESELERIFSKTKNNKAY